MPKPNKPPAFLFYVDDFSSDGIVEAMTTEGVGAYILLLCKAWREEPVGSLPDNDFMLARWSRLSIERWAEVKPAVLAAFMLGSDSRWHQKRMRAEFARLAARSGAARASANARWKRRKGKRVKTQSESNANALRPIDNETATALPEEFPRKTVPPTLEAVRAQCLKRGNSIEPERFMAHYEANGWMVGKSRMKDWHAAIVKWEQNEKEGLFKNGTGNATRTIHRCNG